MSRASRETVGAEIGATLRLALPLAVLQLAQVGMGIVTTALAARGGNDALAGVGLGSVVLSTLLVVAGGFFSAGAVLVNRLDDASARTLVRVGLFAALLFALVSAPVLLHAESLFVWARQHARVGAVAAAFLGGAAWGAPAAFVFAAQRQFASGLGRPYLALVTSALGLAVLVVLGRALPASELSGVVYARALGKATAAAYWVSSIAVSLGLFFGRPGRVEQPGPHRGAAPLARSLFRLGLPTAAMFAAESGFFAAMGFLAGRLGPTALGAHHIAVQTAYLTFMIPSGIGMATAIRVARASGDMRRARRAGLIGIALAAAFMLCATLVLLLAPRTIARAYLGASAPRGGELESAATGLLVLAGTFQIADGVQGVASAALRGLGIGFRTFALGTGAYWLVGVLGGAVLAFRYAPGIRGLWCGIALGIGCAASVLVAYFLRVTAPRR